MGARDNSITQRDLTPGGRAELSRAWRSIEFPFLFLTKYQGPHQSEAPEEKRNAQTSQGGKGRVHLLRAENGLVSVLSRSCSSPINCGEGRVARSLEGATAPSQSRRHREAGNCGFPGAAQLGSGNAGQ